MGGIPKPQHLERTRVLSVGGSHRYKNHGHHRHEASKQHESKLEKDAQLLNNETFKLWDDGPNFDTNLRQNVVALVGRTAYLTCRVFDRGNKTVTIFIGSLDTLLYLPSGCFSVCNHSPLGYLTILY